MEGDIQKRESLHQKTKPRDEAVLAFQEEQLNERDDDVLRLEQAIGSRSRLQECADKRHFDEVQQ
jgi:hypothetical protein